MKEFCNLTQGLLYWWSHPCLNLHAETLGVRKGTGWEWTGRMVLLTLKILKGFSYEIKRKPDKWPSSIYLTPYLSALLTFSSLKYVSSLINLIFSLFSKCIFMLKVWFHIQNVFSFSEYAFALGCVFIFKMFFNDYLISLRHTPKIKTNATNTCSQIKTNISLIYYTHLMSHIDSICIRIW